jgi:D-tyrosyl-tRNA(Tyr) deacylase
VLRRFQHPRHAADHRSRGLRTVRTGGSLADTRRGNRPSFSWAADPAVAEPLVSLYIETLKGLGVPVAGGRFGADMQVALVNDGPVTIVHDAT